MKTMVLDVGGTVLKSAIFENGSLNCIRETPSEAGRGGSCLVNRIIEVIKSYQGIHSFERIGICTAGQVNPVSGSIIYANQNIPGYTGTRLKHILETEFSIPVCVENDVNAAALGEAFFGAGRGEKDFVCLTYGTGIGGAIFSDGSLFCGSSYSAGEFGAIITHPEDRDVEKDIFSGSYEKYASTTALVQNAMKIDSTLTNGHAIFNRIGEPAVKQLVDKWIIEIIYGLTTITHILNPSCIILGGGVMEQPYVTEHIKELFYSHIIPSFSHVKIKKAELGNRAGMLGAALTYYHPHAIRQGVAENSHYPVSLR